MLVLALAVKPPPRERKRWAEEDRAWMTEMSALATWSSVSLI